MTFEKNQIVGFFFFSLAKTKGKKVLQTYTLYKVKNTAKIGLSRVHSVNALEDKDWDPDLIEVWILLLS